MHSLQLIVFSAFLVPDIINGLRLQENSRGQSEVKVSRYNLTEVCGIEGPSLSDGLRDQSPAGANQWPWAAALFMDDAWFCNGALISENFVLTTADCVNSALNVDVILGALNLMDPNEPGALRLTAKAVIIHEGFNVADFTSNNIALVQLPFAVDFSDYIRPSCLPKKGDIVDFPDLVTGVAWTVSDHLSMSENLSVIPKSKCFEHYGSDEVGCIDNPPEFCLVAGASLNKKSDQRSTGDKWFQVGIAGSASSAGCNGVPLSFTRTEQFLEWISANTGIDTQ